jgi:predicted DNA-binding protein with PD1-like motif
MVKSYESQRVNLLAARLEPDQDLKQALKDLAIAYDLQAGCILSAIGSLKQAKIRFAGQSNSEILTGKFEILALNGMLSIAGVHVHVLLADDRGRTLGGHLDSGCVIYTTAEIAIARILDLKFLRTLDPQTGFLELEIKPASEPDAR